MTAPGAPSGTAGGLPPVGGLADEAAQLLDALAARLALIRGTIDVHGATDPGLAGAGPAAAEAAGVGPGDGPPSGDAPDDGDSVDPVTDVPGAAGGHPQCVGWCPVCRSADLLRGERPEVAGKLLDSALVVVGALRSLLPPAHQSASRESAAGPATSGPATSGPTAAGPAATTGRSGGTPPPSAGIERIDIR